MFEKGQRVKCVTKTLPSYFGELGSVVVTSGRRYKVLFDKNKVEGEIDKGQNLANAHWCFDIEIDIASEALDAPEDDDEDYIGCADYSDPSPNHIEECSGGSYEANLMGSPGTRRGDAIRNFRSFR